MNASKPFQYLALAICVYLLGLRFLFSRIIPGAERPVLWLGEILLLLSVTGLCSLAFRAIRARLKQSGQTAVLFLSLATLTLYSFWAGSQILFPVVE
jgi:hypothetical protein